MLHQQNIFRALVLLTAVPRRGLFCSGYTFNASCNLIWCCADAGADNISPFSFPTPDPLPPSKGTHTPASLLLNKLWDQGSHPAEIGGEMYSLGNTEIALDTQIMGTIWMAIHFGKMQLCIYLHIV